MKDQLLDAPIGSLRGVHFVFRGASELVGSRELLKLAPRAADHPQHLAIERNLEDSAGEGALSHKKHLVRPRRDADRIGSPNHCGQTLADWSIAIYRLCSWNRRHVNGEHTQKLTFGIEHLDAPIGAIAHIEIVVAVRHNGMRDAELAGPRPLIAP